MKTILALLVFLVCTSAFAETITRARACKMYAHTESQNEMATIYPGNEMTVQDTVDGFLRVTITGYIPIHENAAPSAAPKKSAVIKRESSDYSGRCQATTKKGTQCKRNAQAGSNYCWQHQR